MPSRPAGLLPLRLETEAGLRPRPLIGRRATMGSLDGTVSVSALLAPEFKRGMPKPNVQTPA